MKKTAAAVGALTAVIFLTGGICPAGVCSFSEVKAEMQQNTEIKDAYQVDITIPIQEGTRIAVVSKNVKGEFWELVRQGMEDAVSEINDCYDLKADDKVLMTFEGPDDEQHVEEQINILDAVIAENPDVLCLSVGDMESCQAQLEAASENGIPVIVFDSNVDDRELVTAFRATDNLLVGEMAAEKLIEAMGGSGTIAIFSAQEKTESIQRRVHGFLDVVSEHENISVVETIYMDQVEDMEASIMETVEKYPDLCGVFCTNADVADIYLDVKKSEDFEALMVGVDATTNQQNAIEDGMEIGSVSQNPYRLGFETILTALKAVLPETDAVAIEKTVLLAPKWIDEASLKDPKAATYLYE